MGRRYEELDSLRGLAATTVMVHHCLITFSIFLSIYYHDQINSDSILLHIFSNTPLHVFWAGHEAVILFFILSGFVLTLLLKSKKLKYTSYAIGRFFRIYLPYITSIAISLIFLNFFYDNKQEDLSAWFNGMWEHEVSIKELVSYIFMLGYDTHNVNTVTWSLIHEMRISLLFPIIVYLIYKWNWKTTLSICTLVFMSLFVVFTIISNLLSSNIISYLAASVGMTFYYCCFFVLGSILARYKEDLIAVCKNLSSKFKLGLSLIALCCYTIEWWIPLIGELKYSENLIVQNGFMVMIDISIGISVSIVFILALSSSRFSNLLNLKPLLFLGKISYSLYLVHPIVLLLLINLLKGVIPISIIMILVPVISIIVAWAMYHIIEKPSIVIGKKIDKLLWKLRDNKNTLKTDNVA